MQSGLLTWQSTWSITQIVVNGFERTGITTALSGKDTAEENPSDSCSEGSREDECEDYASEDGV